MRTSKAPPPTLEQVREAAKQAFIAAANKHISDEPLPPGHYLIEEAVGILKVKETTLRTMIKDGRLKSYLADRYVPGQGYRKHTVVHAPEEAVK